GGDRADANGRASVLLEFTQVPVLGLLGVDRLRGNIELPEHAVLRAELSEQLLDGRPESLLDPVSEIGQSSGRAGGEREAGELGFQVHREREGLEVLSYELQEARA